VLKVLGKNHPALLTIELVTAESDSVSEKTASRAINQLIGKKLACRPAGSRQGATLTDEGMTIFRQFASG
jgi:hypothetical protein